MNQRLIEWYGQYIITQRDGEETMTVLLGLYKDVPSFYN